MGKNLARNTLEIVFLDEGIWFLMFWLMDWEGMGISDMKGFNGWAIRVLDCMLEITSVVEPLGFWIELKDKYTMHGTNQTFDCL